jgi:hypothetical protein
METMTPAARPVKTTTITREQREIWTKLGCTEAEFPALAAELAKNLTNPSRLYRAATPRELARRFRVSLREAERRFFPPTKLGRIFAWLRAAVRRSSPRAPARAAAARTGADDVPPASEDPAAVRS